MFFIYAAIMRELFFFFNVVFFAFSLCLCPTFQHGCAFFIERIALRFVVWGNWRKCCTTLTRRGRCFLFRFLSGSLQWRAILGHFKWHWGIYHMHHRMPKVPMLLVWASWWYHCLQVCVLSSCLFFFLFFQCYNDYNHLRETQSSRSMFTPSFVEINGSVFLLSARYFIFLVDPVIL